MNNTVVILAYYMETCVRVRMYRIASSAARYNIGGIIRRADGCVGHERN